MSDRLTTAQAIFDDFITRQSIEALIENVTDDIVYKVTIPVSTPLGGEFHGKTGVSEFFARVAALLEICSVTVNEFIEGDDKVVVLGDEILRVKSTGEDSASEWCAVLNFRGAQVSRILVIEDHSPLYAALLALAHAS